MQQGAFRYCIQIQTYDLVLYSRVSNAIRLKCFKHVINEAGRRRVLVVSLVTVAVLADRINLHTRVGVGFQCSNSVSTTRHGVKRLNKEVHLLRAGVNRVVGQPVVTTAEEREVWVDHAVFHEALIDLVVDSPTLITAHFFLDALL